MVFIAGCAERTLQLYENNKVVGECITGYDWHLYGLQDSNDYMLYFCAKDAIDKGLSLSDPPLLEKDFSLPQHPQGLA